MTSPSPAPLTPAEAAAASEVQNFCWHTGPSTDPASLCGECDKVARAVVAAVRGPIEAGVLDMAAEDLEQMAEQIRRTHTAAQPNRPGLQVAAEVLRGRAAAFRQSLSLPASKETQQ